MKEALEKYGVQRKKTLDSLKTERQKKRTVQRNVERTKEAQRRKLWSKKHGHDTYGGVDDMEHDIGVEKKGKKQAVEGKCKACGSNTHQRSNHKECPFNKQKSLLTAHPHVLRMSMQMF